MGFMSLSLLHLVFSHTKKKIWLNVKNGALKDNELLVALCKMFLEAHVGSLDLNACVTL